MNNNRKQHIKKRYNQDKMNKDIMKIMLIQN